MSWIDALLGPIAGIGSALIGANASNKAANAQVDATNNATALQKQIFEEQRSDQQPFLQGGYSAEQRMLDLLGLGTNTGAAGYGSLTKPFSMSDFEQDPGYSFRLSEGLKALDKTASARGGLLSGSALKGVTQYGQNAASQEYQNAFNRFQVNRSNILNPLQSLAGAGQTAANTIGADAGQYGTNAGANTIGAGNARASGYVGGANAVAGGVGQFVNQYNQGQWLNAFMNRAPGASVDPAAGGPF